MGANVDVGVLQVLSTLLRWWTVGALHRACCFVGGLWERYIVIAAWLVDCWSVTSCFLLRWWTVGVLHRACCFVGGLWECYIARAVRFRPHLTKHVPRLSKELPKLVHI